MSSRNPEVDPRTPGAVLAALRTRAELTQHQLAELSGVAVRTIRNLERGSVGRPRGTTLDLLARALDITPADLAFAMYAMPSGPSNPVSAAHRLPAAVNDLTGRDGLMAQLSATLASTGTQHITGSANVVNLSGRAGVGKSCLAAAIGHQLAPLFPDSQLWVDLGGSGPAPRAPHGVLGDLLVALDVDPAAVPRTTAERASLLGERMAGRRLLLVLDDAADETQIELLLVVRPTAVLVTSRRPLALLPGVTAIDVETLSTADSATLLTRIIGPERAAAEPAELQRIVAACAGLPLALRIAGARLIARPRVSLGSLAGDLADEHRRLAELRYADLEVRAPLQLTLDGLDIAHRRAFALLGRLDVPHFPLTVVEAVLGTDLAGAQRSVDRLVDARLLDATSTRNSSEVRYRFHDLLRLFARETPVGTPDWRAALYRLAGRLLALAGAADSALPGTSDVLVSGATQRHPATSTVIARIRADPETWFLTEESTIGGIVSQLLEAEHVEPAWDSQLMSALLGCSRAGSTSGDPPTRRLWPRARRPVTYAEPRRCDSGSASSGTRSTASTIRNRSS